MSRDIGELFDKVAVGYDERLRRTVPCYEELYGAVLGLIPVGHGENLRVLDLGSGTGILAAMVGETFPGAGITLVDLSQEMMNLARKRFADEPDGRYTFHIMDYVNEDLPGRYDAVVSALSLHHVEDEDKRKVFGKVYDSLEEGGVFINADQYHRAQTNTEAGHHGAHHTHHNPKTHESPVEEQLDWMREAGFVSVERTYENGRFVVCAGWKEEA